MFSKTYCKVVLTEVDSVHSPIDPVYGTNLALLAACNDLRSVSRPDVPNCNAIFWIDPCWLMLDTPRNETAVLLLAGLDEMLERPLCCPAQRNWLLDWHLAVVLCRLCWSEASQFSSDSLDHALPSRPPTKAHLQPLTSIQHISSLLSNTSNMSIARQQARLAIRRIISSRHASTSPPGNGAPRKPMIHFDAKTRHHGEYLHTEPACQPLFTDF